MMQSYRKQVLFFATLIKVLLLTLLQKAKDKVKVNDLITSAQFKTKVKVMNFIQSKALALPVYVSSLVRAIGQGKSIKTILWKTKMKILS
jgi:cystathionine beta-lyase family protein involved in aluminum resistance